MGKKAKAPKPPDPIAVGASQTASNIGTAVANSNLNMVNQVTPDGTLNYSQSGMTSWTDPVSGRTFQIPQFTATQTYSPQQQAIKNQSDAAELNFATLANNQSGRLGTLMSQPFQYTTGDHEKWAMGLWDSLNKDKMAQDTEALRSRLVNQGLVEGSAGWDAAMRANTAGMADARNRFLLESQGQGFGQAQSTRNQPINEITALLSGSQVSQPNYVNTPQSTIAGTDYAGLQMQGYNNQLNRFNANQAQKGALMGGLFGIGSAIAGNPYLFR